MKIAVLIFGIIIYSLFSTVTLADDPKLITVQTKRGSSQPFLFAAPDAPKAGVIMFIGSNGDLEDSDHNFLVRTHEDFVQKGLMVAIVGTPSDKDDGIYPRFRISKKHAGDMARVIKYMKKKADVPVWLVGISLGTFSAASVAIKKQKMISGLVLTSSITRSAEDRNFLRDFPEGVLGLNLQKIKKPVLVVVHKGDKCDVTPPADISKFKGKLSGSSRVEILTIDGGFPPIDEPCESRSQHGFYGKEKEVVDRIVAFIIQ